MSSNFMDTYSIEEMYTDLKRLNVDIQPKSKRMNLKSLKEAVSGIKENTLILMCNDYKDESKDALNEIRLTSRSCTGYISLHFRMKLPEDPEILENFLQLSCGGWGYRLHREGASTLVEFEVYFKSRVAGMCSFIKMNEYIDIIKPLLMLITSTISDEHISDKYPLQIGYVKSCNIKFFIPESSIDLNGSDEYYAAWNHNKQKYKLVKSDILSQREKRRARSIKEGY